MNSISSEELKDSQIDRLIRSNIGRGNLSDYEITNQVYHSNIRYHIEIAIIDSYKIVCLDDLISSNLTQLLDLIGLHDYAYHIDAYIDYVYNGDCPTYQTDDSISFLLIYKPHTIASLIISEIEERKSYNFYIKEILSFFRITFELFSSELNSSGKNLIRLTFDQ